MEVIKTKSLTQWKSKEFFSAFSFLNQLNEQAVWVEAHIPVSSADFAAL